MAYLRKSPERGSFGGKKYLEKRKMMGKDTDQHTLDMIEYLEEHRRQVNIREQDAEWQKDNLEYDLRTSDIMVSKAKASEHYAQNLYAAMCNNDFQKLEVLPVLKDQRWSCSWRYAGGIVADMQQHGDYIDWYCSGIRGDPISDEEFANLSEEKKALYLQTKAYVGEGFVTDEIRADLKKLGWLVIDDDQSN